MLRLAETESGPFVDTPWADGLFDLGARANQYINSPDRIAPDDQLFIAITVPVRDMAASLIAAGWMMTAPVRTSSTEWRSVLAHTEHGILLRMITNRFVILDRYLGFDGERLSLGGVFGADAVRAVSRVTADIEHPCSRMKAPPAPPFGRPRVKTQDEWVRFLCSPPEGLAVVGSKAALLSDLAVRVGVEGQSTHALHLGDIVLPRVGNVATWATELISPPSLPDDPEDAPTFAAAILDGAPAIKAADQIDAPLLIAVVDRSVMDDTASELVVQRRNTRGVAIRPDIDLGWMPPPGIEVAAFRTRR